MPCKRKLNVDYTLTANLYLIQRNPGSALTNSFKSQLKPQLSSNAEQITARTNESRYYGIRNEVLNYWLTTLLLVSSFIYQEYLLVKPLRTNLCINDAPLCILQHLHTSYCSPAKFETLGSRMLKGPLIYRALEFQHVCRRHGQQHAINFRRTCNVSKYFKGKSFVLKHFFL